MTEGPKTKLAGMIGDLRYYRRELATAEQRGDEEVAESMRRMIRTEGARIREHCAANRIPRPAEVPEED